MSGDELDRLELDVDSLGDRAVVTVRGEVDTLTAALFAGVLDAVVDNGCRDLVVDCGGVTFIDAAGLRALERAALRLREAGASLVVRSSSDHLRRVLDITGVSGLVVFASPKPARPRETLEYGSEADLTTSGLAAAGPNRRLRSSTATVDAALRLVTALAATTVENADGVSVTLERRGRVLTVAASDDAVKEMDRHQYETGEGPCLAARAEGRWFYVESLAEETRWPTFVPLAFEQGIRSILSSPLLTEQRPQGALNIYSSTERAFGTRQQELAALFAEQASDILTSAEDDVTDEHDAQRFADALTARQVIHQAQGVLMGRNGMSAEEAVRSLHRAARAAGITVVEHATEVVGSLGHADGEP